VAKLRELLLPKPTAVDHKYSRGIVGFVTGSTKFPGAALLGVTAAIQSGCGYVRYVGNKRLCDFVMSQKPEVVCEDGFVDAWVLGSGVAIDDLTRIYDVAGKFRDSVPLVLDAGAMSHLSQQRPRSPFIITPHHKEARDLLDKFGVVVSLEDVAAEPKEAANKIAELTGAVVCLKANVSVMTGPGEVPIVTDPLNPILATAGTGDLLAGITGTLVARHVRQIGVPDKKRLMFISALALKVLSTAGDFAEKRSGIGASDIAANIHLATRELAK
jgi:hydroxyethylthiazole kinase-like uncharacterized protein yjeF